ncbi:hypothetical protein [Reyranella soli]|uniref:hypothetical protein n=1 Tax=Reyranella soli TaxID=1230389 RepID=UPI001478A89B|nr:hypothetical protein [Reyranella soli]
MLIEGNRVASYREWALLDVRKKREQAAEARRLAQLITLKTDRDALLAQAADLEARAPDRAPA